MCRKVQPAIDTDVMATEFLDTFKDNVFCVGQPVSIIKQLGQGPRNNYHYHM